MTQFANVKTLLMAAAFMGYVFFHVQFLQNTAWNIPGLFLMVVMVFVMGWWAVRHEEETQLKALVEKTFKDSSYEVAWADKRQYCIELRGMSVSLSLKKPKNNIIDNSTNSISISINALLPESNNPESAYNDLRSELSQEVNEVFGNHKDIGLITSLFPNHIASQYDVEIPCRLCNTESLRRLFDSLYNVMICRHELDTRKIFCKESQDDDEAVWWVQEGENMTHSIVHIPDQDYWGFEAAYDINLFTDDSQAELISRDEYLAVCDKAYEHLRKDIMS